MQWICQLLLDRQWLRQSSYKAALSKMAILLYEMANSFVSDIFVPQASVIKWLAQKKCRQIDLKVFHVIKHPANILDSLLLPKQMITQMTYVLFCSRQVDCDKPGLSKI